MLVKNKPEDFNSSQKHLRDYLREKLKFNGHVKRERVLQKLPYWTKQSRTKATKFLGGD